MRKHLLLNILILSASNLFAQTSDRDSIYLSKHQVNLAYTSLYRENGEMSYTSPLGELGAPSKYILNGKLTTTYMVFGPRSLPIAFSINPEFTARVRSDKSSGVRTPSFRLGGIFYVRLADHPDHYKYAEVGFTHHSNGQDQDAVLPNGEINTATGNFNANYLTASYAFGHFTDRSSPEKAYYSYNHKVGLLWHKWFNYEKALSGDFGFTRLKYDFSFRVYQVYTGKKGGWKKSNLGESRAANSLEKETWRFNGQFSYAINQMNLYNFFAPKRRINAEVSANYSLPFMQNVFLMASFGYYGEDPYNIYFKDRYAYTRFGLSSTFSRYKVK